MFDSIAILIVLILISGVLSASEIALSSANRSKVKMLVEAGDKRAARLLRAIEDPGNFFATTQLYITFIAFFSGAYAANTFTDPIMNWLHGLGWRVAEPVVFITITAVLTYVTLILGELVPKRIAMQYAIPFALRAVLILNALSIIALPFVKALSATARGVLRLVGIRGDNPEEDITKEEIRLIVESGSEHGHIDESEHDMIENIFELDSITAADICTHRMDVIALPIGADFETVVSVLTGENYTRVPVYEESLDNILGILHSKDVLHYMAGGPDTSAFDLAELMREPYFVPLSKKAAELFQEMREERAYMAVVIDEYGGTMGIVTMQDFVSIIVGSIHDEYDDDAVEDVVPIDENTFLVQGAAALESLAELLDAELPTDEYDTVSGFLVGLLGYIPSDDEKPETEYQGLKFKIESVHEKRVATVVVIRTAVEHAEEPS